MKAIDTGDHVRHGPTGEEWLVAYVEGDRLAWCGWPPGLASTSDCTLLRKASAEQREQLLLEMALLNDHRGAHARHVLAQQMCPHQHAVDDWRLHNVARQYGGQRG